MYVYVYVIQWYLTQKPMWWHMSSTVMDAREVMLVITGAHKSLALAKCVEEGVNHMWTVSAIQMHPKGLIVCDEDATLELHVKVRWCR